MAHRDAVRGGGIHRINSGWVQNSTLSTEDALAVVSQIAVRVDVAIESNGPHT
jgi:ribosomal protein L30/L7E